MIAFRLEPCGVVRISTAPGNGFSLGSCLPLPLKSFHTQSPITAGFVVVVTDVVGGAVVVGAVDAGTVVVATGRVVVVVGAGNVVVVVVS